MQFIIIIINENAYLIFNYLALNISFCITQILRISTKFSILFCWTL